MAECTCADPQAVAKAVDGVKSQIENSAEKASTKIDETLFGKEGKTEETGTAGKHGRLDQIRFCHWAAPEWGPMGENAWTMAFQAAQLAISITNSIIQGQIADMKEDLAEGYYQQAKYKWDRFAGHYKPLEEAILWEASNEPIREINCSDDRQRAEQSVNPSFDSATQHMKTLAQGYRLCPDPTVVSQMEYTRTRLAVDTENYNLLDDNWFVDFKNDQRWARRSNILNLGRNLGSIALQYGNVARSMLDTVGDQINKAAGSLSQALGYYGTRFDTNYSTTYLSGETQSLISMGNRASEAFFTAAGQSTW